MRTFVKSMLRRLSGLLVLPAVLCYRLQAAICGADSAFFGWSQLCSLVPGKSGQFVRHAFYSRTVARCGHDACIGFGSIASHTGLSVGRGTYIGNFCSLGWITLEDDVLVGSHVSIMNGCRQHGTERVDLPIREQPGVLEPVTIGEGSWIGEGSIVAASVGRHCIIGTGSLVISPVPDYAIAVGSPARVIRDRRDRATEVETRPMECVHSP